MFRDIVFNKNGSVEIPSTSNGGEVSKTEHNSEIVPKAEAAQPKASDRRVRRTRKQLHDAFISLVVEQGYEKTTIQHILDRADVGRSTFYVHYRDKEALLTASFDEMGNQLEHELAIAAADSIDVTLPAALLFEHAFRNKRAYRALCGHQGGALVQRHLRRLIADVLRNHLEPELARSGPEVPGDVAAEFYTSAALGLLVWWIGQDFCHDHVWLTLLYRRLACPADDMAAR
jgi:AcrR family transcriptional regulator